MSPLVVLTESDAAVPEGYTVRLGPLEFITPADTVSESVGDGLDAVGAALVPTERKPRPLKLKLPVRGYHLEADAAEAGRRLRRQVRELLENSRWRLSGFYFTWDADPDLDGWLMIGGGDLGETDPGITFGEFDLDLSDVFIVGRPGTHRPGRRLILGDRRGGLVARDTRRMLYSTDFASQAIPLAPLVLPGDIRSIMRSGNQAISLSIGGPYHGDRRLWYSAAVTDGDIVSYMPDADTITGRGRFLDLDEAGAVRVWDLSAATEYPPLPASYTPERDTNPHIYWGWERVLGDVLTADAPLAVDNGVCRLIWLGPDDTEGLAIEYWDEDLGHYDRVGRVLHASDVREARVVEATPERAVLEWRDGPKAMRAILQRGWWGPRLESYDDSGAYAVLEYAPITGGTVSTAAQTPSWVRLVTSNGAGQKGTLWAQGAADEIVGTSPVYVAPAPGATFKRYRILVAQLAPDEEHTPTPAATEVASLSLTDARAIPVLVGST